MAKAFKDLSEREILALAITNEEEDGRIYGDIAEAMAQSYPATAEVFRGMQASLEGRMDEAEQLMQRALEIGSRVQGENAVQFFAAQLMT